MSSKIRIASQENYAEKPPQNNDLVQSGVKALINE